MGLEFAPEDDLFRDHIILFGSSYEKVDHTKPDVYAEIVKYFKLFETFMPVINKEFTSIRSLLVNADSHSFYPFLYINHEYLRVTLTPPYVNYCYMPIPMPPAQADFHSTPSFCALERSVDNKTCGLTRVSIVCDRPVVDIWFVTYTWWECG